MDAGRLKTFRTFSDDGPAQLVLAGDTVTREAYRTVVEFIIQLGTDDELDPTQAAELFIVRLCLSAGLRVFCSASP